MLDFKNCKHILTSLSATIMAIICIFFFLGCIGFENPIRDEKVNEGIKKEIIKIDGNDDDWHNLGIQPFSTSQNDPSISDKADIKSIYLATDGEKIYALMQLYDNVSTDEYLYGISLSPNMTTIYFEFDQTGLSVKIEGGNCGFSAWIKGQDTKKLRNESRATEYTFNSNCVVNGKNIEFMIGGKTPIYIFSYLELQDDELPPPLTPYTMIEKVPDFHTYGIKVEGYTYHIIDKKLIKLIEKRGTKISDVITKI